MIFTELNLSGAYVIDLEPIADERGFFARTWCAKEFEEKGLFTTFVQCNISHNKHKGTIRGLHYQVVPYAESKVVRCIRGAIYDVIVDLRTDSKTFRRWLAVELNDRNKKALYIPRGFAHGFQTLEADVEVFYQMSEFYHPDHSDGLMYDDPALAIIWPYECASISEKDTLYKYI